MGKRTRRAGRKYQLAQLAKAQYLPARSNEYIGVTRSLPTVVDSRVLASHQRVAAVVPSTSGPVSASVSASASEIKDIPRESSSDGTGVEWRLIPVEVPRSVPALHCPENDPRRASIEAAYKDLIADLFGDISDV